MNSDCRRPFSLLSSLLVLLLPLLVACGGSGSTPAADSGDTPDIPDTPDTPDTPALTEPITVHKFLFDEETREYTVSDETGRSETVSQADVQRDLVGSLCSRCHVSATNELKHSVHYRIAGRTDRVLFPGGGAHGMLDRACGLPATTGLTNGHSDVNMGECMKCHVGRYLPVMEGMFASMFQQMGLPEPQEQANRIINGGLDCLICHSSAYQSHPREGILAAIAGTASPDGHSPTAAGSARDSRDNCDFDHDGQPDPLIDTDGDGKPDMPLMFDSDGDGMPDTPFPTVAQDRSPESIAAIGPTKADNCMRCHEHARTGYKRGTLFHHGYDVHATAKTGPFAGATNQCTVCHEASMHKFVRGHAVGGDLAAADYPPPAPGVPADLNDTTDLTCAKCHDSSKLSQTVHTERHLAMIACETCHIPYGSGITYSLFGHGGQVSFARNAAGKDTKLVVADMYLTGDDDDLNADFEAFKTQPILTWFNGGTSFLAQTLSVRGMPNAKITPFKPMANGMVFDARFFDGKMITNEAGAPYNAHSMYRFYANRNNADAFYALGMLDMTPDAVRRVTMADFANPDINAQAMALMLVFPNLVYFNKAQYGYEHYLTRGGSIYDQDGNGIVDRDAPFFFDMFAASNGGLQQFQAFNGPMQFPADYEWYPPFDDVSQQISMKLPDGSLIKMFLQMQAAKLPEEMREPFLNAAANYPAFSQVTLGGHGVMPKEKAVGATSCLECHGDQGALAHPVPVGRKTLVDMGPMGKLEMPQYRWRYYKVRDLIRLGLDVTSEEVLAGEKSIDIDGDTRYVRDSSTEFVLNWFAPNAPNGYRRADAESALAGTELEAKDLTWNGGEWMPVLEPVVDLLPNYAVLGYERKEVIWPEDK